MNILTPEFDALMANPQAVVDLSYDALFRLPPDDVDAFRKYWIARRFDELSPRIAFLRKLAAGYGITRLEQVDDILPLLFGHTVYKSYPMAYVEKNRFDKLTKWLAGLVSFDISHVDAAGIECIDDWLDLLDEQTPLMVVNSSGTTGKLSFYPRTRAQTHIMARLLTNSIRDWHGPRSRPDMMAQPRPFVVPGYQFGSGTGQRLGRMLAELCSGGEYLYLYQGQRLSADLQSIAGRMRVAEAKGELGALEISPALRRRRDAFVQLESSRDEALARFMKEAIDRFAGRDVYISAVFGVIFDWAEKSLRDGHHSVFGPHSVLNLGGGSKGRQLPKDWSNTITDFLGFDGIYENYGMTENTAFALKCDEGHYHLPPTTVPFLLDPRTGAPLPRQDGTTGRYAFFDLIPDTYWAGIITGDRVTMGGWQEPCGCGRLGQYVTSDVSRLSASEGGDDKVLCSGAPEAHDTALAFLLSRAG